MPFKINNTIISLYSNESSGTNRFYSKKLSTLFPQIVWDPLNNVVKRSFCTTGQIPTNMTSTVPLLNKVLKRSYSTFYRVCQGTNRLCHVMKPSVTSSPSVNKVLKRNFSHRLYNLRRCYVNTFTTSNNIIKRTFTSQGYLNNKMLLDLRRNKLCHKSNFRKPSSISGMLNKNIKPNHILKRSFSTLLAGKTVLQSSPCNKTYYTFNPVIRSYSSLPLNKVPLNKSNNTNTTTSTEYEYFNNTDYNDVNNTDYNSNELLVRNKELMMLNHHLYDLKKQREKALPLQDRYDFEPINQIIKEAMVRIIDLEKSIKADKRFCQKNILKIIEINTEYTTPQNPDNLEIKPEEIDLTPVAQISPNSQRFPDNPFHNETTNIPAIDFNLVNEVPLDQMNLNLNNNTNTMTSTEYDYFHNNYKNNNNDEIMVMNKEFIRLNQHLYELKKQRQENRKLKIEDDILNELLLLEVKTQKMKLKNSIKVTKSQVTKSQVTKSQVTESPEDALEFYTKNYNLLIPDKAAEKELENLLEMISKKNLETTNRMNIVNFAIPLKTISLIAIKPISQYLLRNKKTSYPDSNNIPEGVAAAMLKEITNNHRIYEDKDNEYIINIYKDPIHKRIYLLNKKDCNEILNFNRYASMSIKLIGSNHAFLSELDEERLKKETEKKLQKIINYPPIVDVVNRWTMIGFTEEEIVNVLHKTLTIMHCRAKKDGTLLLTVASNTLGHVLLHSLISIKYASEIDPKNIVKFISTLEFDTESQDDAVRSKAKILYKLITSKYLELKNSWEKDKLDKKDLELKINSKKRKGLMQLYTSVGSEIITLLNYKIISDGSKIVIDPIYKHPLKLYRNQPEPIKQYHASDTGSSYSGGLKDTKLKEGLVVKLFINKEAWSWFKEMILYNPDVSNKIYFGILFNIDDTSHLPKWLVLFGKNIDLESIGWFEARGKRLRRLLNLSSRIIKKLKKTLIKIKKKIKVENPSILNIEKEKIELEKDLEKKTMEFKMYRKLYDVWEFDNKMYRLIKSRKYMLRINITSIDIHQNLDNFYLEFYLAYIGRIFPAVDLDIYDKFVRPFLLIQGITDSTDSNKKENEKMNVEYLNNMVDNIQDLYFDAKKLKIALLEKIVSKGYSPRKALDYLIKKVRYNNGLSFIIEKDATLSFYQLMTLLFRNKTAAKYCNLLQDKHDDLYTVFQKLFISKVNDIIILVKEKRYKELRDYSWFYKHLNVTSSVYHKKLEVTDDAILEYYDKFIQLYNKFGATRSLFKKRIMTTYYGSLKNHHDENAFKGAELKDEQSKLYQNITGDFFKAHKDHLYLMKEFRGYLEKHNKDLVPFVINTPYFYTEIRFYEVKKIRVHLLNRTGTLHINTDKPDLKKSKNAIAPLWIQSMDAELVHEFLFFALNNNINFYTIHDCFIFSSDDTMIIQSELKKIYIKFLHANKAEELALRYRIEPLKICKEGDSNFLTEKDIGDHFVK